MSRGRTVKVRRTAVTDGFEQDRLGGVLRSAADLHRRSANRALATLCYKHLRVEVNCWSDV